MTDNRAFQPLSVLVAGGDQVATKLAKQFQDGMVGSSGVLRFRSRRRKCCALLPTHFGGRIAARLVHCGYLALTFMMGSWSAIYEP